MADHAQAGTLAGLTDGLREKSPKHRILADALLSQIEAGRWRPGEQIPSEDQIAAESGMSLGTVQRALRNLAEIGVVERYHGRGTFVRGGRAPNRHLRHFRFLAEDGNTLLPIFVSVRDISLIDEEGPWAAFLGNCDEGYVRIRREVSVANEFSLYSEVFLPGDRFGSLTTMERSELDGISIRDAIAERFNAPTLSAEQTMMCQILPPRATTALNLPLGTCGIVWIIGAMSYRDAPITWQRVFVPPSDRPLEITARQPWGLSAVPGNSD